MLHVTRQLFNNSTEVDLSNQEHELMPYATMAFHRIEPLFGSPEYCIKNYMTGDTYMLTNCLETLVEFANEHFGTSFTA